MKNQVFKWYSKTIAVDSDTGEVIGEGSKAIKLLDKEYILINKYKEVDHNSLTIIWIGLYKQIKEKQLSLWK